MKRYIRVAIATLVVSIPINANAAQDKCHDLNVAFQKSAIALDQWKIDHPQEVWYKTSFFVDQQKAYVAWETCYTNDQ